MEWSERPDPMNTSGFGESDPETDYNNPINHYEDDILSESDNDIDIDAARILGEELSSSSSSGDDQIEQESVGDHSFGRRIDPSAHEANRYDAQYMYRIKPDPYSKDDKTDPFYEEKKEDPYNGPDIENPSVSHNTFGFDSEKNGENSFGSLDKEGSFSDDPMSGNSVSRGSSGIEVEEIIEFDSVSKKVENENREGFDDEPKEASHGTVQTTRERRIITFLSVFVCCLIIALIIAIAVGIGVGVNRKTETLPPSSPPSFPPSNPPTMVPSSKPSFLPTRSPTKVPTKAPQLPTEVPISPPATEPGMPVMEPPVNEPPIGAPPEPSAVLPTIKPTTTSPESQNTNLLELIIANSLDAGEAVMKPGTPQNEAYKWLLTNAFLTIYSDEQKLTRYALATFFYATNGPTSWDALIRDDGWLTNAPECEWGSTANNQCTKGLYTSLTLDFVGVSGTIPQELGLLTGLERFSVRGSVDSVNVMSGSLPDVFDRLPDMQTIRLNNNNLTGLIPASFGSMTNCLVMILSGNSFIGKIPTELANTKGRTLNFSNNQLSGQIPSELFSLTELNILNLHNNNLSGTIPSEIGYATNISNINFSNNKLGGSIPSEIGNLVEIRNGINFSSNQLSGEIPSQIGFLNKMSKYYLSIANMLPLRTSCVFLSSIF